MTVFIGHCRKKTCIRCLRPGLEVIKLEYSIKVETKHNDCTCPQAANRCALFCV